MNFSYKARTASGEQIAGHLDAKSHRDALRALQA